MFAVAGYWIFERERAMKVVSELLPRQQWKTVRDTWVLIDLKLGAFVRGMALIVVIVATTLSLLFWAIGLPYWLLDRLLRGPRRDRAGHRAADGRRARRRRRGDGVLHLAVLALGIVLGVRLARTTSSTRA